MGDREAGSSHVPRREEIERICAALLASFGHRAITVAETQLAASTHEAEAVWRQIVAHLAERDHH